MADASTWFLFDLVASVPWDAVAALVHPPLGEPVHEVEVDGEGSTGALGNAQLLALLGAVRLLRLGRIAKLLAGHKAPTAGRVARAAGYALLGAHVLACAWLFLTTLEAAGVANTAALHGDSPTGASLAGLGDRYVDALYAVMAMALGGGERPSTAGQAVFACVALVGGMLVLAAVIAVVMSYVAARDDNHLTRQQQHQRTTADYMEFLQLPGTLKRQVRDYFSFVGKATGWFDESRLLESLSPNLATQVRLHQHGDTVRRLAFMKGLAHTPQGTRIVATLVNVLSARVCSPMEVVYVRGAIADAVYIVVNGTVLAEAPFHRVSLRRGSVFGEAEVLQARRRSATHTAVTMVYLQVLTAAALDDVMERHLELGDAVHRWVRSHKRTVATHTLLNWNADLAASLAPRVRERVEGELRAWLVRRAFTEWVRWRRARRHARGLNPVRALSPPAPVAASGDPLLEARVEIGDAEVALAAAVLDDDGDGAESDGAGDETQPDGGTTPQPSPHRVDDDADASLLSSRARAAALAEGAAGGAMRAMGSGSVEDANPTGATNTHAAARTTAKGRRALGPNPDQVSARGSASASDGASTDTADDPALALLLLRTDMAAPTAPGTPPPSPGKRFRATGRAGSGKAPKGSPGSATAARARARTGVDLEIRLSRVEAEVSTVRAMLGAHHRATMERLEEVHDHLFGAIKSGAQPVGALKRRTRLW